MDNMRSTKSGRQKEHGGGTVKIPEEVGVVLFEKRVLF